MDYKQFCNNVYEEETLAKLEKMVDCDYAKNHHLYWQGANDALGIFKDMLWNRRNGGRA
ncbi:hypothetical protein SEA_TEUTSCH_235 [Streptomyces phage Teutsch]|uniref:Uncharacterized protein n=1 Tax=Streptomyces phage Teutsch TaxID=2510588 RepID=A0A411B6E9_9CAUD|nr:hypothetical protein SEA_TEUTSCH_235 [Streptomyces phage Teutsch]